MNLIHQYSQSAALDIGFIARLHDSELDANKLQTLKSVHFPKNLCMLLYSDTSLTALQLLENSLSVSSRKTIDQLIDELAADYAAIYLTHSLRASPFESVWIDEEGLMMQEPMFQIRAWYEKSGYSVPDWRIRSEDHIVHQLDFISLQLSSIKTVQELEPVARFMDEHILRWLEDYSRLVVSRSSTQFYAGLNLLTFSLLDEVRDILSELCHKKRPCKDEIDKRMKKKSIEVNVISEQYIPGVSPSW